MKRSSHSGLVLVVSLLALGGCGRTGGHTTPVSPIIVSIAHAIEDEDFGEKLVTNPGRSPVRTASIDHVQLYPRVGKAVSPVHVLLSNVGQKPVKLWHEWSRPGHASIQFEILGPDGQKHSVKKTTHDLLTELVGWFVLQPGDSVVWDVELTSSVWRDLSWVLDNARTEAQVRAIYHVDDDSGAKASGVWTGRAESKWYDFVLDRERAVKRLERTP